MPEKAPVIFHAFTVTNSTLVSQLHSEAHVLYHEKRVEAKALWDTGATGTCISQDVVNKLVLVPTGKQEMKTPSGSKTVNTYLVDVVLPNKVVIRDVVVCDSDIGEQGIDLLIGMDIILLGDFTVSCFGGKTTYSFRTPSKQVTDYVKQITVENAMGVRHGKGDKKKKR